VLALHGFGATPDEVAIVVETAARRGLRACAPLLPGHGRSVAELGKTSFNDWLETARASFAELAADGPVICAGLSLGSLLALSVTLERPRQVRGLILMANALWVRRPFPDWALRAVDASGMPDFWFPKGRPGIADATARDTHQSYDADPVHAAISVLRAGDRLRGRLSEIQCPTLLLHGARDRVCPVSNAWRAAALLGTRDARVVVLPSSEHVVTRDGDREQLQSCVGEFLGRVGDSRLC
jgi:carboxylesterase